MLKGFVMPENGRITKIVVNGVEMKIEPPIEFSVGDIVSIPWESAQQGVERKSACCGGECVPGIRKGEPDLCSVCGGTFR